MSTKKNYRLQRQKDLLWLRAAVGQNNNSPLLVRLLVDTGATYTVKPTLILERLGCNLNEHLRTTMIVTANGAIEVPIVAIPWFNCLGVVKLFLSRSIALKKKILWQDRSLKLKQLRRERKKRKIVYYIFSHHNLWCSLSPER